MQLVPIDRIQPAVVIVDELDTKDSCFLFDASMAGITNDLEDFIKPIQHVRVLVLVLLELVDRSK